MMAGNGSTQQSIRKALGALKDSTKVGLAKVNSEYKELDVAIVKATNHDEQIAKEKHVHTIFHAVSAARPRADVVYCINSLARRLAKTHNWAVALKTLIVLHRALREADPTFRGELISFTRTRGHILNLSHFKDDSSPNAWDYSAWLRTYALYLEERLECLRILKYDIETEQCRTKELDTVDLFEHLPALQQLLFRLFSCQPEGAAMYNNEIQYALSFVARESIKIYDAIDDGILNLVNKFFDMQRHDAVRALEIYRKAGQQAERLSEFYVICNGLNLGLSEKFVKIKQPPESFVTAMEEYVKEAPRPLMITRNVGDGDTEKAAEVVPAIEQEKVDDDNGTPEPVSAPLEPPAAGKEMDEAPVDSPVTDLLGLDDFSQDAVKLEEQNVLALAIPTEEKPSGSAGSVNQPAGIAGWELALVSTPSSSGSATMESKPASGLDKMTLDSLYDDAIARRSSQNGSYHVGKVAPNPFDAVQYSNDPFHASTNIAPPASVQMAAMAQQQALMRQPQIMGKDASNPFGDPYGAMVPPQQPQNPYTGLM